jgi:hypothetical protein
MGGIEALGAVKEQQWRAGADLEHVDRGVADAMGGDGH